MVKYKQWIVIIPLLSVLVFDQISKWLAFIVLSNSSYIVKVNAFLNITLTLNRGVSFGLFHNDSPCSSWILSVLTMAVVIGLLVWIQYLNSAWTQLSLGVMSGGAMGNIIDRLHYDGVIDFIDCHLGMLHWPTFNLADSAITIGSIFAVIGLIYKEEVYIG